MKSSRMIAALALCLHALPTMVKAEEITLSSMIREIQVALRDSQKIITENQMPALSTVELEMKTVQKDVGGGKINFLIAEVGGSQNTSFTSSVNLKLKPPSPDAPSDVAKLSDLGKEIMNSLVAGAAAIKVARMGNPPLNASSLQIAINFAVVSDGGGGLKLAFPPFGASLEGKLSRSNIQTMKVTFE